jgi:hypothetical protein
VPEKLRTVRESCNRYDLSGTVPEKLQTVWGSIATVAVASDYARCDIAGAQKFVPNWGEFPKWENRQR